MSSVKAKVLEAVQGVKHAGQGETILITGGSGFVAAHVLNAFLDRGYNVRATVRSQSSADKVKKSHGHYGDKLSFAIVPDVQTPGAFDDAVKGVQGVIHTASPFQLKVANNKRDLLDPAIKGTTEVLSSIQKHNPSVKRVVLTSSFASNLDFSKGDWPEHTYTEADWNPITYEEAAKDSTDGAIAYCASKTFAEKAAWDYVAQNKPNFTLTTICPPMVYGPAAHSLDSLDNLNTSSADIYRLIDGSEKTVPPTAFYAFVDVRDVGEAHARAYETPEAAGQRYFVTAGNYTYQQICDIIREDFPSKRSLTPEGEVGAALPNVYKVDNSKAKKELKMTFRDLRTSIHDMVEEFIAIEKRTGQQ